jgi:hypothetical protein
MLVIARFSLGVGRKPLTPVGSAFYYAKNLASMHYVTLRWFRSPRNSDGAARSDSPA